MTAESAQSVLSIVRSTLERGCCDTSDYLVTALGRVLTDIELPAEMRHEARRLLVEVRSR